MNKNHIAILQYLIKYQNTTDNFFNRYFLLKSRLISSSKSSEERIDQAKSQLQAAGLIDMSNKGLLHITENGKGFFYKQNQQRLKSLVEKIKDHIVWLSLFLDAIKIIY